MTHPDPSTAACVAPWVSLEFDPQGWVYTCCANQQYPLGRIGDERLSELWAGERMMVLRSFLARNDLSNGCASCRWHSDHGRLDTDAAVYDTYSLLGDNPPGPASMTFALSNRCNLACVMCNPELSSTIRHRSGLAPIPRRYDDQFFDDVARFLPGLQYAKFLGGEPFLVPEHQRIWTLMDEVGGPRRLQVTTNGTIWTDRVEWLINRFDVDVTVSLDAASAGLYERIREGANFADVMTNVSRFHRRCLEAGTELRFCFCLMSTNWMELAPFLEWASQLGAPVSVNVVSDAGLALHDLPTLQLEAIQRSWDELGPDVGSVYEPNAQVWCTQVRQLSMVLRERRAGAEAPIRQPKPASSSLLGDPPEPLVSDGTTLQRSVEAHRSRLSQWSGRPTVAELRVVDGSVSEVVAAHSGLGIGPELEGVSADELLPIIARHDGRSAWVLGNEVVTDDELGTHTIRTIVLSKTPPRRGGAGTVVRVVTLGGFQAWTMLVAADDMHERSGETAPVRVGLGGTRGTPPRPAPPRSPRRHSTE